MPDKVKPNERVRDADTGRFVPNREAGRRPKTTVTETIRPPKKGG